LDAKKKGTGPKDVIIHDTGFRRTEKLFGGNDRGSKGENLFDRKLIALPVSAWI